MMIVLLQVMMIVFLLQVMMIVLLQLDCHVAL